MMFNISNRMKCFLDNGQQRISGEVYDCKIESDGIYERPKYEVKFFADAAFPSGYYWKKEEKALDLSQNVKNLALTARKVVFNPPATVVLWEDGTKTVVKCDKDDRFDEMKGLALCYMKKALGNTSRELNKALRRK